MNCRIIALLSMLAIFLTTIFLAHAVGEKDSTRQKEKLVFVGETRKQGKQILQEIHGYFTSLETQQSFRLEWRERRTTYGREESVRVLHDGEQVYNIDAFAISLLGVCRSPETDLDQLLFTYGQIGSMLSGGIHFIHYDEEAKEFTDYSFPGDISPIAEGYVDCPERRKLLVTGRPAVPCQCTWKVLLRNKSNGKDIFAVLRPSEKETKLPRHKEELLQNELLPTKSLSQAEFDQIRTQISKLKDQRFSVRDMAENSKWRVATIYFRDVWSSWGVLLVKDKTRDTWMAFYNIPSGGSKVDLFIPEVSLEEDALLKAKLCTACTWWGFYEDFVINLNTMTISSDVRVEREIGEKRGR